VRLGQRGKRIARRVTAAGWFAFSALVPTACARFGYGLLERVEVGSDDAGLGSGGLPSSATHSGPSTESTGGVGGATGAQDASVARDASAPRDASVAGEHELADAQTDGGGDAGGVSGNDGCASGVPLRQRPESQPPVVDGGTYDMPNPGWYRMARHSESVTLHGQGYIAMRWEVEYAARPGQIFLPLVTSSGTFLRVGGGGGYHLDDPQPGTTGTYMGNPEQGVSYMAPGAATPWHSEFYYLDGTLTVALVELDGLVNIELQAQSYSELLAPGSGVYSPGVVCDRP
jgi:hypothetical protein